MPNVPPYLFPAIEEGRAFLEVMHLQATIRYGQVTVTVGEMGPLPALIAPTWARYATLQNIRNSLPIPINYPRVGQFGHVIASQNQDARPHIHPADATEDCSKDFQQPPRAWFELIGTAVSLPTLTSPKTWMKLTAQYPQVKKTLPEPGTVTVTQRGHKNYRRTPFGPFVKETIGARLNKGPHPTVQEPAGFSPAGLVLGTVLD